MLQRPTETCRNDLCFLAINFNVNDGIPVELGALSCKHNLLRSVSDVPETNQDPAFRFRNGVPGRRGEKQGSKFWRWN